MQSLFFSCAVAVFLAEIVGDKTLFSLGSLASRYSARVLVAGLIPACCGKMLAAVLMGHSLGQLPGWLTSAISAVTFLVAALLLWRNHGTTESPYQVVPNNSGAWAAFGTIFFAEWADPGQLTAASFAAHSHAPMIVWLGASVAMLTKAIIGLTIGAGLRLYGSQQILRYTAVATLVVLALTSSLRY